MSERAERNDSIIMNVPQLVWVRSSNLEFVRHRRSGFLSGAGLSCFDLNLVETRGAHLERVYQRRQLSDSVYDNIRQEQTSQDSQKWKSAFVVRSAEVIDRRIVVIIEVVVRGHQPSVLPGIVRDLQANETSNQIHQTENGALCSVKMVDIPLKNKPNLARGVQVYPWSQS